MDNLNIVPKQGTFGGAMDIANQNFSLIVAAINGLEYRTTRSKGVLSNGVNPASAFPNAKQGDWCVVLGSGNTFPATIKTFNGSTWTGDGQWSPGNLDLTEYAKTADMNAAIAAAVAAVEIETADNLTTQTPGKALDAHQGFVLAGQIANINGDVLLVSTINGKRVHCNSDSSKGYLYSADSQKTLIYDLCPHSGKTVNVRYTTIANAFKWAIVNDYGQIPTSLDLETWNSIVIIDGGKTAGAYSSTYNIVIPEAPCYLVLSMNKNNDATVKVPGLLDNVAELENRITDISNYEEEVIQGSNKAPSSNAVYNAIKASTEVLNGRDGVLIPIDQKNGYRLLYSGSSRGKYYTHSSASCYIFDLTSSIGKTISIKSYIISNSYRYAIVSDFSVITTSNSEEVFDSVLVKGVRGTSNSTDYSTVSLKVPTGYEHLYLIVSSYTSQGCTVKCTDDVVEGLTLLELKKLREGVRGKFEFGLSSLGIVPITPVLYDYNVIIGYGQSLSAGSGLVPEDMSGDENALMFVLRQAGYDSSVMTRNLIPISAIGNTSETQDCPPNAPATVIFSKMYRMHNGNKERKFVHICSAQGSMTIAQLMDTARYKDVSTNEVYFPDVSTGYASIRPYYSMMQMLRRLKQIADAEGKTVGVIAVNWHQGEADYGSDSGIASTSGADCFCNGDGEEYARRLRLLHDDIDEDIMDILGQTVSPAWFVAQCSGDFVKASFAINKALADIVDNVKFFELPSTYPVPNKTDGHPTGNGYRWHGEYIAKAMFDVLLSNTRPNTLTVRRIIAKPSEILVYCHVPVPPMRIETKMLAEMSNYGFSLRTISNSSIAIGSIEVSDNVVIIKPADLISGTVSVQYGTRNTIAISDSRIVAAGNICDSDERMANYTCMAEPGSVEYVPLDPDGQSLIGKPYPLYNFLQPFMESVVVEET